MKRSVPLSVFLCCMVCAIFFCDELQAQTDFTFQPVSLYIGPSQPGFGSGVIAFDIDLDSDIDIFIPTAAGQANQLLVNQGDGSFVEQAGLHGLADTRAARSALWMDYEGDGDFDLLVARDCYETVCDLVTPVLSLMENNAGQFTEVTSSVGLFVPTSILNSENSHVGGLSAGDANGDGLPDIYLAIWQERSLFFFSGDFSTTGSDTSGDVPGGYMNAGLITGLSDDDGGHWQAVFHDLNQDGKLDLFINVDFDANQLWLNPGVGAWSDIAGSAGVASQWNEMGLAPGDFDADGDIDFYVTNIHGWINPERRNHLYRNDTVDNVIRFTDVSIELGVDDTGWGWGATWFDADNDGDLDLAVTNGYCQSYCGEVHQLDQSRFFLNPGDGSAFIDATAATGFTDTDIGSTLISADFNRDGRIDLLQSLMNSDDDAEVRLWINTPTAGTADYLRLELADSNTAGTVITLSDDTSVRSHLVTMGSSFLGQEPLQVHFGLGSDPAPGARTLLVKWSDGSVSAFDANTLTGTATQPFRLVSDRVFSSNFE